MGEVITGPHSGSLGEAGVPGLESKTIMINLLEPGSDVDGRRFVWTQC